MKPERWERLQALFHHANDLPPHEWEAYLEGAESDPALREEVLRLLEADADDATLELRPGSLLSSSPPEVPPPLIGRRVGPYRLAERVGEGGMGAVYLAEREDVGKTVALKLVRGALAAPDLVRRFLRERRVLARLEHRHIARLLDAGFTEDETPWFAMEYVDGEPITEYCEARRLGVRDRLRLFRDVCEAVSYAHGRLVVHRDIKPSNVLVTDEGTVKLLDFGIAKLLGDDDLDGELTRTGVRVMSPAYAAPEQVAGEPVTTATDVFSLGVLLYELLTGTRPGEADGGGDRRAGAARPSVVAARPGAPVPPRSLAGDLDAICLQAIAAEPERRYRSAEQLRDDLTRHLTGLPVEARFPTFRYRAGKFVRRHATALFGAALLALSLGGGLGAAVWQGQRAERSRADAERARDETEVALTRSRSVSSFFIDLFQQADPTRTGGREVTALDLVERGAARIDDLDHDPVLQALLLENLAHVNLGLGRYSEASTLAARAVSLRRPLPPDSAFLTALNALGMAYNQRGLPDSAAAAYQEALPLSRQILGEEHDHTLAVMNNLAIVQGRLGHHEAARSLLREMIEIEGRTRPDDPVRTYALNNLGIQLAQEGRLDEAEPLLRESLRILLDQGGDEDLGLASGLDNLGMVLRERGRYEEAEPMMRRALSIRREILGDEHRYFAESLFSLGTLLALRARPADLAEADSLLTAALAIYRSTLGPEHRGTAYILHSLGVRAENAGDLAEAERRFRQALAIRTAAARDYPAVTVHSYAALARVLRARGRSGAVEAARDGLRLAGSKLPAGHPDRAEVRVELGLALAAGGQAGGTTDVTGGAEALAARLGPDHPRVTRACDAARTLAIEAAACSAAAAPGTL